MLDNDPTDFVPMPKIPRLYSLCTITEKIDGSNACIHIESDGITWRCASRNRYLDMNTDNFGFYKWCTKNINELLKLGPGKHFGEWWGSGIQRGYGLTNGERYFSLFNVGKWNENNIPSCCKVVPIITSIGLPEGPLFDHLDPTMILNTRGIDMICDVLIKKGSIAMPGYMNPEGIIIYHSGAQHYFKYTFDGDGHKNARG